MRIQRGWATLGFGRLRGDWNEFKTAKGVGKAKKKHSEST